jgi:hypothetical protein
MFLTHVSDGPGEPRGSAAISGYFLLGGMKIGVTLQLRPSFQTFFSEQGT